MKSSVSKTPLHFEHVDGNLKLTLQESSTNGFGVQESTFSLIVPHVEVPDVVENMMVPPDMSISEVRKSDKVQDLVRSSRDEWDMIEEAFRLIVAANIKAQEKRSLREKTRLVKIAKAFCGMSDREWDELDSESQKSYIANALRAEQAMSE